MSFLKFMAEWGLWDILGLLGAIIPTLAVVVYLFPRRAMRNFYIDSKRESANVPYSKVIRIEMRNHTNEPLYVVSEGFVFGSVIRASPEAAKHAVKQVYEIKFQGGEPDSLTEIDALLRPRETASTWVPVDPSQDDEDIDAAIRNRAVGTLRLKCQRLSGRRHASIQLRIPV
jgi:hypothetical protein